jgi:hypothetical protein
MKKLIFTVIFLLGIFSIHEIAAQNYNSAVGIRGGFGFTGTYKKFINENNALEVYAGLASYGGFVAGAMYQIHKPLTALEVEGLDWYFGGGVYAGTWGSYGFGSSHFFLGLNGVIGLDYTFEKYPLNISADFAPGFNILQQYSGSRFNYYVGGASIRYILGN